MSKGAAGVELVECDLQIDAEFDPVPPPVSGPGPIDETVADGALSGVELVECDLQIDAEFDPVPPPVSGPGPIDETVASRCPAVDAGATFASRAGAYRQEVVA